jgi:hypothetical protein
MDVKFTFAKKKKILERIHKLTDLTELKTIKSIIEKYNSNVFTKNNNGYHSKFDSYVDETYIDLLNYLNKLDKKKLKQMKSSEEEYNMTNMTSINITPINTKYEKKYKLTNTENLVINRAKYDHAIRKNNNNSDDEITLYNSENIEKINRSEKLLKGKKK